MAKRGAQKGKKRVLVVEDEEALRRALEIRLLQEGYRVDTAANGREALAALDRAKPNIVLLDLMMPVMDGVDFLKTVRVERALKVPVVVLTVMTSGILVDQCKTLEIDEYLVKDKTSLDDIAKKVLTITGKP